MLSAGSPHSWAMPRSRWGVPPPWGGKSSDRRPGRHARKPESPKKSQGPETESHGPWRGERSLLNPHEDFANPHAWMHTVYRIFSPCQPCLGRFFLATTRKVPSFHTLALSGALPDRALRFRALFLGTYRRYAATFKRTLFLPRFTQAARKSPIFRCLPRVGWEVLSASRDAPCPCPLPYLG